MQKNRREFLKKAGIAGAVAATAGAITVTACLLRDFHRRILAFCCL